MLKTVSKFLASESVFKVVSVYIIMQLQALIKGHKIYQFLSNILASFLPRTYLLF